MTSSNETEFPAWQSGRYIGLAELLIRLGGLALDLEWACNVEEAAPEPGNEKIEELRPDAPVTTLNLLSLVSPDRQIIDGRFEGYSHKSGEMIISIQAVDSTSWVVESKESSIVTLFSEIYSGA